MNVTIEPIDVGNSPAPSGPGPAGPNTPESSFGSVIDNLLSGDSGTPGVDQDPADDDGNAPSESPGQDAAAANAANAANEASAAALVASLLQAQATPAAVPSVPAAAIPATEAGDVVEEEPEGFVTPGLETAPGYPTPGDSTNAPLPNGGDAPPEDGSPAPNASLPNTPQPPPIPQQNLGPNTPVHGPVPEDEPPLEWVQFAEQADQNAETATTAGSNTAESEPSMTPPDDQLPQERPNAARSALSNAEPGKPAAVVTPKHGANEPAAAASPAPGPAADVSPTPEPAGGASPTSEQAAGNHPTPVQSVTPAPVPQSNAMLATPAAMRAFAPPAADDEVVVPQLVRAMRLQMIGGVGEARLQLEPRHLGAVSVALRVQNGVVSAVVTAEQASVRQWIAAHESTLRQALAEQGLLLDTLQVERDGQSPFDRSAQEREQAPRRRAPRRDTATFELVA